MASVTFPLAVGGDGSTVDDTTSPTTGLDNGGHRTRFIPALTNLVNIAANAVASAVAAAASAASALNAPGTSATSTTSLSVAASGTLSPTVQTGKAFSVGQRVALARTSAPTTAVMYGAISAYNSGTGAMSIVVDSAIGAGLGPFTDWTVSLSPYGITQTRQVLASGLATGGGDLTADRTIAVPSAAAADVRTGTDTTKAMTAGGIYGGLAVVTLTDAATIPFDMGAGINATVTLGGNRTLGAPTNAKPGQCGFIEFVQDGTGSRTLAFASAWKREGGAAVASTTAGAKDYLFYEVINSGLVIYSYMKAPS